MDLFLYVFAALFSVTNPLGTVPIFVGLTQDETKSEQSKISVKTAINIFVIFLLSFFVGKYILEFFGISIDSLRIAGGLIIVSSGFALLTGNFKKHKGMHKEKVQEDVEQRDSVSLTPLAIPMLAGPGAISLLIALNDEHQYFKEKSIVVGAVACVCRIRHLFPCRL